MDIIQAQTDQEYAQGRILFKEYADSIGIDLSYQNFGDELKKLQEIYAPPEGFFLLAKEENVVGCVGVRPLQKVGREACEMKRLYVRPSNWGQGIGLDLIQMALKKAKTLGYKRMFLDTLTYMKKAISLYKSIGFGKVDKYYDNPRDDTYYLKKDL